MDPYKYDAQGNLLVWTGTGYQVIPKIAQGDLSYYDGKPQSNTPSYVVPMGDNEPMQWGGATTPSFNFTGDAAAKYGNLANMNVSDNNFRIQDATPEGFNLLLKSADKEGTRISYALKDGQWVPTVQGTQGFDTNAEGTADFKGLGTVAAAALAGGALFGADGTSGLLGGLGGTAAPGTMTTYGVLDTSMALPGTQFAPFAGDALTMLPAQGNPSIAPPGPNAPNMSSLGVSGLGGALDPAALVNAGSGATGGMSDIIKAAAGNPNLLKLGGAIAGGLLGGAGESDSGSGGSQAPIAPTTIPKLYGEGGTSGPGLMNSWGAAGPTETERRMRQQYLPGLLGGANPWGY